MRRIAAAILALFAAGCTVAPGTETDVWNITIWHDDARDVTCWVYNTGYAGGISCLPDAQVGEAE